MFLASKGLCRLLFFLPWRLNRWLPATQKERGSEEVLPPTLFFPGTPLLQFKSPRTERRSSVYQPSFTYFRAQRGCSRRTYRSWVNTSSNRAKRTLPGNQCSPLTNNPRFPPPSPSPLMRATAGPSPRPLKSVSRMAFEFFLGAPFETSGQSPLFSVRGRRPPTTEGYNSEICQAVASSQRQVFLYGMPSETLDLFFGFVLENGQTPPTKLFVSQSL